MTRERLKELWPVMEAWRDGQVIQARSKGADCWNDMMGSNPGFHDLLIDFRIKPKPREFWVNIYGELTEDTQCFHLSKAEADMHASGNRKECIHLVEVLE